MRHVATVPLIAVFLVALLLAGCGQAAPAPASTTSPAAPTKAAEPAKAAAAAPTAGSASAAPTKAPEAAAKKVEYPEKGKPINFIVTWAPGAGADISGRALASAMERQLGVPIPIINDGAASTQSGLTKIAAAKPDGYTIGQSSLPTNITTYLDPARGAVYTRKSFQTIAGYVTNSVAIAVKADSPYKTLQDLVDDAKARPGQVKMGSSGIMAIGHLMTLMFEKAAGIQFQMVQFPGNEGGMAAILGGHVDAFATGTLAFMPQVTSGDLRILATSDHQRDEILPNVKTFEEQGCKVYLTNRFGMVAPAGTPMEIVNKLSSSVKAALQDEDVKKRLAGLSLTPAYLDPEQYGKFWEDRENDVRPMMDLAR
jgi:tripartite-type tricarboxylate transporter receptor subunit TctC